MEVEVSINGDSAGKQDRLFKVCAGHNHEYSFVGPGFSGNFFTVTIDAYTYSFVGM